MSRRPTALILRALGLGDLLTAVPALRAVAEAFPDHRRVLAAPRALLPLVELTGAVDEVVDVRPFEALAAVRRPAVAVNLHGRGSQSHRMLLATAPGRLIAFEHPDVPESAGMPRWTADEHEVLRWCRLLRECGVPADPERLELPAPGDGAPDPGLTVVHPGAASAARRWPPERWVEVVRIEASSGRRVVLTGADDELALAGRIAAGAGLDEGAVAAGRTGLRSLASLVARAGLVISGDTGVAHLATAFGTPSVVLFGPTPPSRWGPPPHRPQHVALWAGETGDPHDDAVDPGLLRITVDDVVRAAARTSPRGGASVTRRIALISEHASPLAVLGGVDSGGQNVYVGQVAKHLAALGYDVDVFTRRDSEVLPDVAPWVNGVRIVHLPAGPPTFLEKERLLEHMDAFTDAFLEHARRRRRSYDLVHANFFMSGLVAAEAKRRLGIPFVITFHALGKVRRLHQGAADRFPDERFAIEERCVAEADHVIAECPQDEEDLIRLYGADPARTTIVPAGVDPGEFWPMSPQLARMVLGFDADERIVLHVGRIVPRKGIDTVIRGFASLVRDRRVAAKLVIVGGESDDPDLRRAAELRPLRRLARDEGVDHLATFAGRQPPDRLKHYYSAADVFVTTPWYEPFGITPLESMACGTPVIGANVGGIKFSVRDGETGYLIPPGDAGAIADRIEHLYRHPRLREVLGRNGVRRVNDMFTWGHVARSLAAIYEDVLAASGRGGRPADAHVRATVASGFDDAISTLRSSRELLRTAVIQAADVLASVFARGGKLLVCGNGGSAADAQHFAAEFVGRFKDHERPGLPAIALTADTSVITAWANDVDFDSLFARQVQALGRPGDALVAISTSGRSANVVAALEEAAARGLRTIALLGRGGGDARSRAELSLVVPSEDTQRIQETQIVVLHVLCELVEERLFSRDVEVVPARAGAAEGERGAVEREAG